MRLLLAVERRLAAVVVTPRLHGIHHSIVQEEQDSNWSSGLTLWDRLHGTFRANAGRDEIEIDVAAYREPEDVSRSLARNVTSRSAGEQRVLGSTMCP